MIQLKCPHCDKEMRAGDEHAGKKVRCPKCKEVVPLPAAPTAVKAAASPAPSPVRKAAPPPVPKRRPVDEDDEDAVEMTVAEDEPEEDDEDERSRKRPKKKKRRRGEYADCPECGSRGFASTVGFTWWGGVVGPWLFTHVRCNECGTCYNGRTGGSNTTAIVIYTVVGALLGLFVVGAALVAAIGSGMRH